MDCIRTFESPLMSAHVQEILRWIEDLDVLRLRSCSRVLMRSTTDLNTGRIRIAHVFNVSRHLSQETAVRIAAECLSWPALCSVRSADLDRMHEQSKRLGAAQYNAKQDEEERAGLSTCPTAVARISVALGLGAAALRMDQPTADALFPALRVLDLDAESLNVLLDTTNTNLQQLLVTFIKEAPSLQEVRLPFYADDAPKLQPHSLCLALGLPGTGPGASLLASLRSADLLNSIQLPQCTEDAWWTGFACRSFLSLGSIDVFPRASEGCFVITEDIRSVDDIQAFATGFFKADDLQERPCLATGIGFSGVDLRGPCRELAQFLSAFPNFCELCFGGFFTSDFDAMGCLVDQGTFSNLVECAPERLARLQTFSMKFSDGLSGNKGFLSFLRACSPCLRELDLSGCDFGGNEAKLIANEGCTMPALRAWSLVKCPISNHSAAKYLGQAVARFRHLEELNLEMCIGWNGVLRASFVVGLGDYPEALLKKICIGDGYRDTWPPFKGGLAKLKRELAHEPPRSTTGRVAKRPAIGLKRPAAVLKRPASSPVHSKRRSKHA